MNRTTGGFVLVAALFAAWPAAQGEEPATARVQAEGQWFDSRTPLGGAELQLNGTGVRAVAWFKGSEPKYQTAVNRVLRDYMLSHRKSA